MAPIWQVEETIEEGFGQEPTFEDIVDAIEA